MDLKNIEHHITKSKKFSGQCLCWAYVRAQTQIGSYFKHQVVPIAQSYPAIFWGTCHKAYYHCWMESNRVFNKGFGGLSWYKCLLLLSVLFKNSSEAVFQIEIQLLFPEALPDPAGLWSLSDL